MSGGAPSPFRPAGASLGLIGRELTRLYGLPDRFLGRALIDLARNAITADPDLGGDPRKRGYESLLIRSVLPRLARALGETGLTALEAAGARAAPEPGPELRTLVGTCLNNAVFRPFVTHPDPQLRALTLGFANGSPVTIGLDRVSPPTYASDDWVARHIREVSRARFGNERFSAWEPAMQDYPGRGRFAFRRRPEALAEPAEATEPTEAADESPCP
ncbi:MAG: hypothetical protein KC466_17730 [Myxococcales bacterium]|nr:hypothetical protein [Myxococcales bacterium]